MVMRLMRYLFRCDHKKRSFQSKMHQKPSGGCPEPLGEFERSPDPLAVLGGWAGTPRKGERREGRWEGRGRREEGRGLEPPSLQNRCLATGAATVGASGVICPWYFTEICMTSRCAFHRKLLLLKRGGFCHCVVFAKE